MTAAVAGATFLLLDRRAARSQSGHLSQTLQVITPTLTTTVCLVLTGASLVMELGGGLYWFVPTVLAAMVGGVLSAWLFLVEQVAT